MSDNYRKARKFLSKYVPEQEKAIFFFKTLRDIPDDYGIGLNGLERDFFIRANYKFNNACLIILIP